MSRMIIKLQDDGRDYYLEWSTICEAPLSYGMSLGEFTQFYREEYGEDDLEERLERVEAKGTSSTVRDLDTLIARNQAGPNKSHLSKELLIEWYCRKGQDPPDLDENCGLCEGNAGNRCAGEDGLQRDAPEDECPYWDTCEGRFVLRPC